jgi:sodium transport system permease protein
LVVVATPALLMTIMLTRSPKQTLLLHWPRLGTLAAGVLLALSLHPTINLLQTVISRMYPLNAEVALQLDQLLNVPGSLATMLLVIAVLPAVCEELAFRGFVLSGLRHVGHKWTAIVISSVFFAATHAIFQQSLVAFALGLVLGFVAIQTGSILPAILFHITHNSLGLLLKDMPSRLADKGHWLHWLARDAAEGEPLYRWPVIVGSLAASAAILFWFHRQPYDRTREESLQEAIDRQSAHWLPG